jgi:hypothetical protein
MKRFGVLFLIEVGQRAATTGCRRIVRILSGATRRRPLR